MGLFGGGKKQTTTIPASGFYALPAEYQSLYKGLLGQAGDIVLPGGEVNTAMFTPLAQTSEETKALQMINRGLAPTPESLQADLAMLQNPFNEYVINDINRQSQGVNSLVNQAAGQAGQMGSNRSFLGTSDVEQQRLNSIGAFRQGQYNTAINQALGPLAGLRQQDITNLMGGGAFQRDLDAQTKQAPYNALLAGTGALNTFQTSFGNFGSPEQTITTKSGGGGLGGLLGSVAPIIGGAIGGPAGAAIGGALGGAMNGGGIAGALQGGIQGYLGAPAGGFNMGQSVGSLFSSSPTGPYLNYGGFFSDVRLKENIEPRGIENGYQTYEFNYKGSPEKYIGVMAQDIQEIMPDAVHEIQGYLAVDYNKIGVKFREVQ